MDTTKRNQVFRQDEMNLNLFIGGHKKFDELYQQAKSVLNPRRLSDEAEAGGVGAALLTSAFSSQDDRYKTDHWKAN